MILSKKRVNFTSKKVGWLSITKRVGGALILFKLIIIGQSLLRIDASLVYILKLIKLK